MWNLQKNDTSELTDKTETDSDVDNKCEMVTQNDVCQTEKTNIAH